MFETVQKKVLGTVFFCLCLTVSACMTSPRSNSTVLKGQEVTFSGLTAEPNWKTNIFALHPNQYATYKLGEAMSVPQDQGWIDPSGAAWYLWGVELGLPETHHQGYWQRYEGNLRIQVKARDAIYNYEYVVFDEGDEVNQCIADSYQSSLLDVAPCSSGAVANLIMQCGGQGEPCCSGHDVSYDALCDDSLICVEDECKPRSMSDPTACTIVPKDPETHWPDEFTWPGNHAYDWQDRVSFQKPGEPIMLEKLNKAVAWLKNHAVELYLPGGVDSLIAWYDPTIPETDLVAYTVTDNLWVQKALMPFDPLLSARMKDALLNLGWYGNGLFDALFHSVHEYLPFQIIKKDGGDPVHGTLMGNCIIDEGTNDERTVQLRGTNNWWSPETMDFPNCFIDSAVYQAMSDFFNGNHNMAIQRIKNIILRRDLEHICLANPWADVMFWDTEGEVLVDLYGYNHQTEGWPGFNLGWNAYPMATYKLAILLYAMRVMNITSDDNWCGQGQEVCNSIESGMINRLAEMQIEGTWDCPGGFGPCPNDAGGFSHEVAYMKWFGIGPATLISKGGITGEATSSAILAHTVVPLR